MGIDKRHLVINNVEAELMASGYSPKLREITAMLKPRLAGVIQSDANIRISTNLGIPIVLKEGTYIEENFNNICDRILDTEDVSEEIRPLI